MEIATQTVTDIFANDREPASLGFRNDHVTDRCDFASRFEVFDGQVQAVEGALRNSASKIVDWF